MTLGTLLMWIADVNLVFSYWLLGRKKMKLGFALSVAGSLCFVIAGVLLILPALWSVNLVFIGINGWNLVKLYREAPLPARRKGRYAWFGSGI